MPSLPRSIFCLIILLQFAPTSRAAESASDDFFEDSPLILTASRMSKPLLESPASVSVIDRQMITASGVRDIPELLRLVPGFVVGFHSGHAPVVTYHGLGQEFGRQIQVLVDGRSVFIPSFGGVPWSNLPLLLEDVERIEVIRGPNAVTYGANAFLATINIITRDAAEDSGSQYSITTSDNANPDIEDAYLRIGSQQRDVDWRLSLGAIADEGFAAINDSRRISKANFRMDIISSQNQFWTLQVGTSNSIAGRGFPPSPSTSTDIERDEEATNSYLNIQWDGVWDSSTSIARLTHTRQKVVDNYDPGPFDLDLGGPPVVGVTTYIDFDRISNRTDLELIQTTDIGTDLRLVYGGSLRRDQVKSLYLFNDESYHEVDTARLFGSVEWRFEQDWLLDFGVMLEDSSITSLEHSPRISLIRKFEDRHALRLVASAAKRNPILYEYEGETEFTGNFPNPLPPVVTIPNWIGNRDIEPENIESFELGLRSQLGNGLASDIKLFRYEIENHIVLTEIQAFTTPPIAQVDVGTTANGETTTVDGVDFEFSYKPDSQLAFRGGLSLINADSSENTFEESFPEYTAFVSTRYRTNQQHEFSATLYYLDAVTWIDGRDVPDARRLDLRYAYHFSNALNIEVIGQNLLEDFTDYERENVHDQVVYVRLTGGF